MGSTVTWIPIEVLVGLVPQTCHSWHCSQMRTSCSSLSWQLPYFEERARSAGQVLGKRENLGSFSVFGQNWLNAELAVQTAHIWGPSLDMGISDKPFKIEDLSLEVHMSSIEDRRIVLYCLENSGASGCNRIGAASQAVLIEEEQIDFNKRNEYKYFEWRKGESREIMFD